MWRVLAQSVTGTSHHNRAIPCQDAHATSLVGSGGILVVAVADGAGSARFAEVGAAATCRVLLAETQAELLNGTNVGELTRESLVRWLLAAKAEVTHLAEEREVRPRELACTAILAIIGEELARVQHLKSCFLSDAEVSNIGDGRKQMLAAYNILTANDVDLDSVMQIKGFGPKLAGNLVAWRNDMARQFRFDKSKGVPETELRGLAAKYRKQQETFFRDIEQTLGELESLEPKARKGLTALVPELKAAVAEWWQADEDVRALRRS